MRLPWLGGALKPMKTVLRRDRKDDTERGHVDTEAKTKVMPPQSRNT